MSTDSPKSPDEHRSLRSVPRSKRKVKLVEELLETPETAHALDRIAESIRMDRQKRQAALTRKFQALRERYTEHELDKVARMVEEDPGLLLYWQQRGELVDLSLALVLSRRKHGKRWSPWPNEIAALVDRVAESTSRNKARKRVAKMLGKSEDAVKKSDSRSKKRYNEDR